MSISWPIKTKRHYKHCYPTRDFQTTRYMKSGERVRLISFEISFNAKSKAYDSSAEVNTKIWQWCALWCLRRRVRSIVLFVGPNTRYKRRLYSVYRAGSVFWTWSCCGLCEWIENKKHSLRVSLHLDRKSHESVKWHLKTYLLFRYWLGKVIHDKSTDIHLYMQYSLS